MNRPSGAVTSRIARKYTAIWSQPLDVIGHQGGQARLTPAGPDPIASAPAHASGARPRQNRSGFRSAYTRYAKSSTDTTSPTTRSIVMCRTLSSRPLFPQAFAAGDVRDRDREERQGDDDEHEIEHGPSSPGSRRSELDENRKRHAALGLHQVGHPAQHEGARGSLIAARGRHAAGT